MVQYRAYLEATGPGADRKIDRVQTVERHIGRFNEADDIKRWMSGKGGIRVCAQRVVAMQNQGSRLIGTIEFCRLVFCAEQFAYAKDQRAEVIACRLAKALMLKGGWVGTGASSVPEAVRADNLYTTAIDKLGLAIWSVTWRQDWRWMNPSTKPPWTTSCASTSRPNWPMAPPSARQMIELPGPTPREHRGTVPETERRAEHPQAGWQQVGRRG